MNLLNPSWRIAVHLPIGIRTEDALKSLHFADGAMPKNHNSTDCVNTVLAYLRINERAGKSGKTNPPRFRWITIAWMPMTLLPTKI
jgi:hypothetical protein